MFEASAPELLLCDAPRTRKLAFRLITNPAELPHLVPAWQQLLHDSRSAEPMCSPGWLLTWWSTYAAAKRRSLRVGLFHDGEQLVGLAPCCMRRCWHRPGIPLTRLECLGDDDKDEDGVCSSYLNLIALAGHEDQVRQAFAQEVMRGSFGSWHEMVLNSLNGAENTHAQLAAAFSAALYRTELHPVTEAPYLTLPRSWETYLTSLPGHKRKYLVGAQRAFETWAAGDWHIEQAHDAESLARGEAILHELHTHRWRDGEGITGAFSRPRFVSFHKAYMRQLLEQGGLDLTWLVARGQPIGISYHIRLNRKLYLYQSGRRLDLPGNVRPGIILTIDAIRRAIQQGLCEYDFLGGPAQYKSQFTTTSRPLVRLRVARSCPCEWLRCGGEFAIDCARRVRERYRQWMSREV